MSSTPLITCRDLHFSYGGKEVLHGLSFSVDSGGLVGLLGKNGAGKSTAINILMGFLKPDSGECTVLGHPSHSIPPEARRRIGLLHEGFIQYDFMTIAEIEKYYSAFYPKWSRDFYYDLVNKLVEVPHHRKISKLSCGQRSQITLGLILAQMPELMILDDFSMGLDVGYRRLFLEFLRDYVDDNATTVLLTSHVVQELESFLDNLIVVQNGNIIASERKETFLTSFYKYQLPLNERTSQIAAVGLITSVERGKRTITLYGYANPAEMSRYLASVGVDTFTPDQLNPIPISLEDAFLGLTGRY